MSQAAQAIETPFELPTADDALINEHQLSSISGFPVARLRNDRYLDKGIPFLKFGASVRYRVGDYRGYLQQIREEMDQVA